MGGTACNGGMYIGELIYLDVTYKEGGGNKSLNRDREAYDCDDM